MHHITYTPKENPYFQYPGISTLTLTLQSDEVKYLLKGRSSIHFYNLLLSYGASGGPKTDFFCYLDSADLSRLKNDANTILVFDRTFEGYAHGDEATALALDYSCKVHGVNPKKVFMFTGNLSPIQAYTVDINIIPIFLLHRNFWPGRDFAIVPDAVTGVHLLTQNYRNIVLSLSRRNRLYRVWAHFMLNRSAIASDCIISQDRVGEEFYIDPNILNQCMADRDEFEDFKRQLPIIADEDNFHINMPFATLPELHSSTLLSIVNETLIDNENGTSLFFSEKFLKPIINFQPMIIYGQPGINKRIAMLGFKTYESYFNLDFDDEPDNIKRYQLLLESVTATVKYVKELGRDQQIRWRFKHQELLEHNHRMLLNLPILERQLKMFTDLVQKI